jgi:taurine dioxygenase
MSRIDVVPQEGCGAEIRGVDLRNMDAADLKAVKAAFAEHGVVFFRDQSLSEDDHIALAECFGPININRFFAAHPAHPEIAMVAKEADQTDNIGGGWHTDHSYDREPALGSGTARASMTAVETPCRAKAQAKVAPTIPAPTTMTS